MKEFPPPLVSGVLLFRLFFLMYINSLVIVVFLDSLGKSHFVPKNSLSFESRIIYFFFCKEYFPTECLQILCQEIVEWPLGSRGCFIFFKIHLKKVGYSLPLLPNEDWEACKDVTSVFYNKLQNGILTK